MHRLPTGAPRRLRAVGFAIGLAAIAAGCGGHGSGPARLTSTWCVGSVAPAFDPSGPPLAVRAAIEQLLSHGLFAEDSSGHVASAPGITSRTSSDGKVWTFTIAPTLRFTNGAPATSADFRAALERGLARTDHGTGLWRLSSLEGIDRVRAGRPLPKLGIETPDPATLILHLHRPDPDLAAKLAAPGAAVWRGSTGPRWEGVVGLGPYRVSRQDSTRRLLLVRAASAAGAPDTMAVRFLPNAGRTLAWLRDNLPDLVWPVPSGIARVALPEPYHAVTRAARPARRLLLVMRADLPPTSKLPARAALAQSLNVEELVRMLGDRGRAPGAWTGGGPRIVPPTLDDAAVRQWMDLAKLGRSFHVRMAFDADGPAAPVARVMQGQWARLSIDVELVPLRGDALARQLLSGDAQLLLVEEQPLIDTPGALVADLVMPLRGPAVGSFRTGWRTRELDAWLEPRPGATLDPDALARRLEDERIVVPIADLPWFWVEHAGAPAAFHPHLGPEGAARSGAAVSGR